MRGPESINKDLEEQKQENLKLKDNFEQIQKYKES